ncbi:phosphate starvation-inducible protein PhoH [Gordonia oryzae]|uniref:PhoH-like protein n=1 Tax=Gordonia oryzae TaxID=2487349 RepID=A0A3N4GLD0_9ACTN|nr:PhoH family protein [Gordonia oryzae]RPA62177.1 phosphate starvation-inducible protein PhoH [Gordonia oryzae]
MSDDNPDGRAPARGAAGAGPVVTSIIDVPPEVVFGLLGTSDVNLRTLEQLLPADIHVRGNQITLRGRGADVAAAERVMGELADLVGRGTTLTPDLVRQGVSMLSEGATESPADVLSLDILSRRGKTIRPKTLNQKRYVDAIDANTIVFGLGPAGTGKTYLAMAKAVQALQSKSVNRIILTRPAVEAGERLGFLPGTLSEKIDPYLRPLYDALHDMMDPESIPKLMAAGVIEVAPLAYMRGRAQPVSTRVLTPQGFRPIGDIEVGDHVIASNGTPTEVLGVYPQGFKDIVRVTTADGASTLCSTDHLWSVYTPDDRRRGTGPRVLETKEMIGNLRAAHYHRFELPLLSGAAEFPRQPHPLDPYALGLILGDGCIEGMTTPSLTTADRALVDALVMAVPGVRARQRSDVDYVLDRIATPGEPVTIENAVTHAMRELGLWGTTSSTTFVPKQYLLNSSDVRLAVLQGLLDTDSGAVTQTGRSCRVQYVTVSDQLRDDVMFLVRSLGGVVYGRTHVARRMPSGRAPGREVLARPDAHVLDIRLPDGLAPFRMTGKAQKFGATTVTAPKRYIESIESVGTDEAVCIRVAAEDSLYVTEDFLLTHNTLNDAFIILDEAQNTTGEQMKMFLTRLGFGSKVVVTGDTTQVDLPGGAQSGLMAAARILDGIDDIHFATLTSQDVVRHRLVADIVDAYGRAEEAARDNPRLRDSDRIGGPNRAARRSASQGRRS